MPALPGWKERSKFIEKEGSLEFYHYDFYGQALSKIERWHARDEADVAWMLGNGLVDRKTLWDLFCASEAKLIRYPAVHAVGLRARVRGNFGKVMKSTADFEERIEGLPFAKSIRKGLADLEAGRETVEALLIQIAETRLRSLDVPIPKRGDIDADRRLYALLGKTWDDEAHS